MPRLGVPDAGAGEGEGSEPRLASRPDPPDRHRGERHVQMERAEDRGVGRVLQERVGLSMIAGRT